MFPDFQNDPNSLPAIIEDAAVLAAVLVTDLPANFTAADGTVAATVDIDDYEVISAYNADGLDVAADVALDIEDVLDGTELVGGLVTVEYVGAEEGTITVNLSVPGNADAVVDSEEAQEEDLNPVSDTPPVTTAPIVDTDASAPANVPADLEPRAQKRWNV